MRNYVPLIISLLAALLPMASWAQDCDCVAADNCPAEITPNFTGQICYDINDALNNDLADPDQGVCGISLTFTHQHVWDLEITLVAPNGQSMQLVGPNTNAFGTTNSVLWDVLFIPCGFPAEPDTINGNVFEAIWDNDQNWPFAAIFEGTYYPSSGNCLENFNSGQVNGTWCLQIDNQPSTYPGDILNFEVLLCDNSGLLCCDADGGEFPGTDQLITCQGDSSLILDLEPEYGPIVPSPDAYGYTFVVSDSNGVILELDTLPDLTNYSPGTYGICGLSYFYPDSNLIPAPDSLLTIDSLSTLLNNADPLFCGDLTEDCLSIVIVPPPPPVFMQDTICQGDIYLLANDTFTVEGDYMIELTNAFNCDSLIHLSLAVLELDTTYLTETICAGESFPVGDSLYTQSGAYENILTSDSGCDSLVYLDLQVIDPIQTSLADTICQGQQYMVGDSVFTASGNYIIPLTSGLGCDSMVLLDLTALNLTAVIAAPDTINCYEPQIQLDGTASSTGTGIQYTWTTDQGQITGDTFANEVTVAAGGTYYLEVLQSGCSNIDTVEVIADDMPPIADAGVPDTLNCYQDTLLLDGTASSSGPSIDYQWSTSSGNIITGAQTMTPAVDLPATYVLVVMDSSNGCADTASVLIAEDLNVPFVEAGPDRILNCQTGTVVLDGSETFQTGPFEFTWTDANGAELAWQDSLQLTVTQAGIFYLSALNLQNGCSSLDSVTVLEDVNIPLALAAVSDSLSCQVLEVSLEGSGSSSGPSILYSWTSPDGNITGPTDSLQTTADEPGTYVLTVTDTLNGCVSSDSTILVQDTLAPMVNAGIDFVLNCNVTAWTMGVSSQTAQGPQFSYTWTNNTGDTIGTNLNHTVSQSGVYSLSVWNTTTGCSNQDEAIISSYQTYPLADAGQGGQLTCDEPVFTLDGSASTDSFFMIYTWYTIAGEEVGNTQQVDVNTPATYCLVVENGLNFCADTSCVIVSLDDELPLAEAGPPAFLDCVTGEATLDGSNSSGPPGFLFSWTTQDGQIISDSTQPAIAVNAPGTYHLEVINAMTECSNVDSVLVSIDTLACTPQADAGADGVINCYSNLLADTLDGSQSSTGPDIIYQWTTQNGSIISGANGLTPIVTEGTYVLEVTNTLFNLSAFDTVVVMEDFVLPLADAGPDQILDCATLGNNIQLDGSNSSVGPGFSYFWETDGGNIVSGANTLFPIINAPGIYSLQVNNEQNGCNSVDALVIGVNGILPDPCIPEAEQIACGDSTIMIGDTCATGNPYVYSWISSDGLLLSDPQDPQVQVGLLDSVGQFTVLVTDTTNSCTLAETVQVFEPTSCFPVCEIQLPEVLTCGQSSVVLDATGSSAGTAFVYSWSSVDGSFCGPTDSLLSCADAIGIYELTIVDTTINFTCTASVEVLEDVTPPLAEAGDTVMLGCNQSEVVLNGLGSATGASITYEWTGPGAACLTSGTDGLSPTVTCLGVYYLEVTDSLNGCVGVDSVVVVQDTLSPFVQVDADGEVNCVDPSVTVSSQGSSLDSTLQYAWFLDGDPFPAGADSTALVVQQGGVYCLQITNSQNNCQSTACVEVQQDADVPFVDAGPDEAINCADTVAMIQGSADQGPGFSYLWTTVDGCIAGSPTGLAIETTCPGTYTLTVIDQTSGCEASDVMSVMDQTNPPLADAGPAQQITCDMPIVTLDGSGSDQGGSLQYSWETPDGNILSGAQTLSPQADQPGLYFLILTDTATSCRDTAQVAVTIDGNIPLADAGPDTVLSCLVTSLLLDGGGTSMGTEFTYTWMAQSGGNILSGANTLFPLIDAPGVYELTVTDTTNQCSQSAIVEVGLDTLSPQAVINTDQPWVLTCAEPQLNLSAAGSQPVGNLSFSWSTTNGHIVSGENSAEAIVDSVGNYVLTVTNTSNGCIDEASANVLADQMPPTLIILEPALLTCARLEVGLDASQSQGGGLLTALWEVPTGSGQSIDHADSLVASVSMPGTYFVTLTDDSNGCEASGSISVQQNVQPPQARAAVIQQLDCDHPLAQLSGSGSSAGPNISYLWFPSTQDAPFPQSSLTPFVTEPGPYFLEVTNEQNGCRDTAFVEVIELAAPIDGLILDLAEPSCYGTEDGGIQIDSVLGGTPPFLFSFEGAPFEPYRIYGFLEAGNYSLQVQDVNGCELDSVVTVFAPEQILVDLGPDQTIMLGDSLVLDGQTSLPQDQIDSIYWEGSAFDACDTCLKRTVSPLDQTRYTLYVTDQNGCTASDEVVVFVKNDTPVYIPNVFSPDGDGRNDIFYIQAGPGVEQIESFLIFDRWGELIFQAESFLPNDPSYGWDGWWGDRPMNTQIVVWMAQIRLSDGVLVTLKGDVLLKR